MDNELSVVNANNISSKIYTIRGQQVMLDADLAQLYGYEVKQLNQQVKRNINRFPEDFMFQLTKDEIPLQFLKSQIVTLNDKGDKRGMHIKKMPFAFTEQGVYMLATVLKGELAEQQSIFLMRAFREMKNYIQQNQQLATKSEVEHLTQHVMLLTNKQNQTDEKIIDMQQSIDILSQNFTDGDNIKELLFLSGQKFEANLAYIKIFREAKEQIFIIDDYVNAATLELLSNKRPGVDVTIFTENKHGVGGHLTHLLVSNFNSQYPTLKIKPNPNCHDRFIVIDYGTDNEKIYHSGASCKDAGSKVCQLDQVQTPSIYYPFINGLLAQSDIQI